jgi:ferric-dicitrate binding protein FerR (iron transport regulator)
MSTRHDDDESRATAVERRLAAALEARATAVRPTDLRVSAPPARPAPRRTRMRNAALGLLTLAATVAALFWATRGAEPPTVRPARPPAVTQPPSQPPGTPVRPPAASPVPSTVGRT